jgi:hypothetical protein
MSSGSSMLASTFKRPPQRAHCSISIPKTPLRRRAQVQVLQERVRNTHRQMQLTVAR